MRLLSPALCSALAVALLAGCSGASSQVTPSSSDSTTSAQTRERQHHNSNPKWAFPANFFDNKTEPGPRYREVLASLTKPGTAPPKTGIYVNEFYNDKVLAYQSRNTANNPPVCTVMTGESSAVNGIATDHFGNFITPIGSTYSGAHIVVVWKGPGLCGKQVGTINDTYGQASNAASYDAIHGTIVVGNIYDEPSNTAGSLSVCTLKGGCTSNLTNIEMFKVAGLALATNGDCWASSEDTRGSPHLIYFAGCSGSGTPASGFQNKDYGDLQIDRSGNLVSIDKNPSGPESQVWVYSGCNPTCTLVGGPYPLMGLVVGAALNHQAMTLAVGNRTTGAVDVYYYSPAGLTYSYSFNNGLSASDTIEGIAYSPGVRPYHPKP